MSRAADRAVSGSPAVPLGLARVMRLHGGVGLHRCIEGGGEGDPGRDVEGDDGTLVQGLDGSRLARPEHELGPGDAPDRRRAVDEGEAVVGHSEVYLGQAGLIAVRCARKTCAHVRIAFV